MRALVISGGGAKGAFAGGIAEYLIRTCNHQYGLFLGTSTGSLIIPLLAVNEIDKLYQCFTTSTPDDIFTTSPFRIHKKHGAYSMKINHWGVIGQFIRKSKTFGNTGALRDLISKNITEQHFNTIKKCDKKILVTVSNLSRNRIEYKAAQDCEYQDFIDWVWASCNIVPFMSLVTKNGQEYADGGFGDLVPIQKAIDEGATEIDVIILQPEKRLKNRLNSSNAFGSLMHVFDFMLDQISRDDIVIGNLTSKNRKVNINYYYTPRILTENSLVFDPILMKQWWKEGLEHAAKISPTCKTLLPKSE